MGNCCADRGSMLNMIDEMQIDPMAVFQVAQWMGYFNPIDTYWTIASNV